MDTLPPPEGHLYKKVHLYEKQTKTKQKKTNEKTETSQLGRFILGDTGADASPGHPHLNLVLLLCTPGIHLVPACHLALGWPEAPPLVPDLVRGAAIPGLLPSQRDHQC